MGFRTVVRKAGSGGDGVQSSWGARSSGVAGGIGKIRLITATGAAWSGRVEGSHSRAW